MIKIYIKTVEIKYKRIWLQNCSQKEIGCKIGLKSNLKVECSENKITSSEPLFRKLPEPELPEQRNQELGEEWTVT